MVADVSSCFRHSHGSVTFPDLEGHIAERAVAAKLLILFVNMPKVTEFQSALSVHLAGSRHD